MIEFSPARFGRILRNELETQGRRVVPAILAAMALGLFAYFVLTVDAEQPILHHVLFSILLLGGGAIFTGTIFSDMHHPLERYHYLLLPCSNLERFLSKFLVSGPLYYLFAVAVYALFAAVSAHLIEAVGNQPAPAFAPLDPIMRGVALAFFAGHALVFLGAVWFRGFALVKTALSLFVLFLCGMAVLFLSVRLVFWEYFDGLFTADVPFGEPISLWSDPPALWQRLLPVLAWLWVLFLAYVRLRDHEV